MKKLLLIASALVLGACSTTLLEEAVLPPVITDESPNVTEVVESLPEVEEVEDIDVEEVEDVVMVHYPFSDAVDAGRLGRIAVISNSMNPNREFSFLDGLDATVYNRFDLFREDGYDTLLIFYQENMMNFYPPMNWNVPTVEVGQLLLREARGRQIIMGHFASFEEATQFLNEMDARIFTLQADSSFEEYFDYLSANPMETLIVNEPNEVEPPNIEATELNNVQGLRLPPAACQLRQRSRQGHHEVFGFPIQTMISHLGTIDVAVVAVDFEDYPGDPGLIDVLANDLPLMTPWSEFYSSGAMTYQVHFPTQWVRAPRTAEWYRSRDGQVSEGYQGSDQRILPRLQSQEQSVTQLIAASDDLIDWSIIDVVIFIFPVDSFIEQTHLYMHMGTFQSPSKGTLRFPVWGENFYELSRFGRTVTYWDWSVHEILHWQGLVGHGPLNHSDYSIMAHQYASSAGLHAWEAFLLGWWDEDDFVCVDYKKLDEPLIFEFDSIDQLGSEPGNKSLMIPLNNSEILVMEYRTKGEWSSLDRLFEGILIYYIDVNGQYVRCDRCDQLEIEQDNFWRILRNERIMPCQQSFVPHCGYPSIVQKPGDRLIFRNLEFEILASNTISISVIN